MKNYYKAIVIFVAVCLGTAILSIGFYKIVFAKYEGHLKTNEDVISNLCGRYPGDEFEVLNKEKTKLYTEDYKGKTIEKNGYIYKVKSKKTNVEFEVSDAISYGEIGHITDGVIFYIEDTYKENWYMQMARDIGCDDKITKIDRNNIIFDIGSFSSFEELSDCINNYANKIIHGDLYKIMKEKNPYESIWITIYTENNKHVQLSIEDISSKDELKKYDYLKNYMKNNYRIE